MKVVINRCYGGFGLSAKAFELWLKKKGKKWVEKNSHGCYFTIPSKEYDRICKKCWEEDRDYRNVNNKGYVLSDRDIPRNDKTLVEIVEKLGEEANGDCANLGIIEIPDGIEFTIEEYDGMEHVAEAHETWC